jgi:hypothetical protein
MLKGIKHLGGRILTNAWGWRTKRKIVVIESDDWGSIRMPSKEVYYKCLKAGYPVDKNPYERFDSLASEDDLELLFDLLSSFNDKGGNHPKITANCVVTNPNFDKINENHFSEYKYELIGDTFKRYPKHSRNLKIWAEGIGKGLFYPQFHAREHLNVSKFMDALRKGNEDALFAFENRMPGIINKGLVNSGNDYVEATCYIDTDDKAEKLKIYMDGLQLFETLFGYKSLSVIPPNYIWSNSFNKPVAEMGVRYIQGARKMREPATSAPVYHKRHLGAKNEFDQVALVRNCAFEPSLYSSNTDNVSQCLKDISIAFLLNKPAIISTHRINYVGYLDESNRDKTLLDLKQILNSIIKKWPDVEFMTSDKLGEVILKDAKN